LFVVLTVLLHFRDSYRVIWHSYELAQPADGVGESRKAVGEARQFVGEAKHFVGMPSHPVGEPKPSVGMLRQFVGNGCKFVGMPRQLVGGLKMPRNEAESGRTEESPLCVLRSNLRILYVKKERAPILQWALNLSKPN
jgi:hypothetical protein